MKRFYTRFARAKSFLTFCFVFLTNRGDCEVIVARLVMEWERCTCIDIDTIERFIAYRSLLLTWTEYA